MIVVTIQGNLTEDIRSYTNEKGTYYRIKVAAPYFAKGEKKTEFFTCFTFRDMSKFAPYLVKGQPVCVAGSLMIERVNSNGVFYANANINIHEITLSGHRKQDTITQPTARPQSEPVTQVSDNDDDDLPF